MKYRIFVLTLLVSSCLPWPSRCQIHERVMPMSATENLQAITFFEDLPPYDSSLLSTVNEPDWKLIKPYKIAYPVETDFSTTNSGQWTTTASGQVWRLGIRSEQAYALYVRLQTSLPREARLFIYAPEYRDFQGAFTGRNFQKNKVFSIPPVKGDRLIIELNLPGDMPVPDIIKVEQVYHCYIDIFEEWKEENLKFSVHDKCEQDINCANGKNWQTEKRAVCKIISNGGMGTGTLIANTSGSNTPYILTAHHLIPSDEIAAGAIFLFNYETTECDAEMRRGIQSLSGAELIATTDHQVDFTLLKLYQMPPPAYQTFFAGWDARENNPEAGICIHHPFGNFKQIAIEYHSPLSEDIGEGFDENSTWNIPHWELGYTEQGSSGAPLFNENHRIVGTLTGGRSNCNYPYDDYFTKFKASWDAYSEQNHQLKYWLDSAQTGRLIIDGYDPYGFNADFCDTIWNFLAQDRLALSKENLKWGWVSGHNSAGYTKFAERYQPSGIMQINGVYLNVAKALSLDPLAGIELKIWEGNKLPEAESYSKLLFLSDLQIGEVNYIPLDSVLTMSAPFFVGYEINYNATADTFALFHTQDRGYDGVSSMYIYSDSWHEASHPGVAGISSSLALGISACYGTIRTPYTKQLKVYPNPCLNSLTLEIPEGIAVDEISCYNLNGQLMKTTLSQTEEGKILKFNLRPGVYYLRVIAAGQLYVSRFIVLLT